MEFEFKLNLVVKSFRSLKAPLRSLITKLKPSQLISDQWHPTASQEATETHTE